jgi:signal transduction histidine kinase
VVANPQQVQVDGIVWPTAADHGQSFATLRINNDATRVLALRTPDGGTLIVGESLAPEAAAMQSLLMVLIAGGGAGLLLSLVGASFLSARALVPIQQAFRRQQEFVADASHELRTPLTVLRSATDLLDHYRDDRLAEHAELLDDVRAEIARMQRLTQDLLTLARSDNGELELMTAPVNIGTLVSEVVRRATVVADANGRQLVSAISNEDALVEIDPDRIQQVLLILLDNALKYTPAGGQVKVSLRTDDNSAIVEVADTGPGIAAEHLPRIFDRFYRADAARSRAAGGTGLGLSIARMLVEAHGGQLSLSSTLGVGTLATLRLPLAEHRPLVSYGLADIAMHSVRASLRH